MKITRREAVAGSGLALAGGVLASGSAVAQMEHEGHSKSGSAPAKRQTPDDTGASSQWIDIAKGTQHPARTIEPGETVSPGEPERDYKPVVTPNGAALPFKIVDGVKVFHLVAEEVTHEFAPGLKAQLWGFNGRVHGPTIEAVEGDRVRIYVTNKLPEATSIHWHGIILPNGMDGVPGLNQKSIGPGETFKYEYPLIQHGTHMYHSHFDEMTQMALGVMGLFVIHPRRSTEPWPDRDFAIMLSEWDIKPGTYRPDPRVFAGFNTLTFNAKSFPATEALVARRGDRVRIRLVNLSAMDHHPIHIHGHSFWLTQTDGGVIPQSARWPETTVLVAVGQSRTLDFVADNPGDWAFHCHMTHHVMNQMGHQGPNMIGADAARLQRAIKPLIPDYMPMGTTGMGDMIEMATSMGNMGNMQMTMGHKGDMGTMGRKGDMGAMGHKDEMGTTGGMGAMGHKDEMGTMDHKGGMGTMGHKDEMETMDHKGEMGAMGHKGEMGGMSNQMAMPENSIAMMGGNGPHGVIDMGGMLTVLKVREHLASYADPGWYQAPRGTMAQAASKQDLERDGIKGVN